MTDDIEFNAFNDLKYIKKELKKDSFTIKNRLQSIIYDKRYIRFTIELLHLQYPVIPNERCGLWYLPPEEYNQTCYFKSTDGHTNEWKFSFRRLNLHLIPTVEANDGIIIIDSTRKGKLIPDALLKTIPIWCSVLNLICFNEAYLMLPKFIPISEYHEILKRLPEFVTEINRLQLFSKESLNLTKPLMPYFLYPGNSKNFKPDEKFHSVVCLSASDSRINNGTGNGDLTIATPDAGCRKVLTWHYIQGSADDHELWITQDICQGKLTPKIFWQFYPQLAGHEFITLSEFELVTRLNELYEEHCNTQLEKDSLDQVLMNPVKDTGIYFGQITHDCKYNLPEPVDILIILAAHKIRDIPKTVKVFQYNLQSNKKGSKQLREILPKLIPCLPQRGKMVILCDTGKDLSIGVVLALLCQRFNLDFSAKDPDTKLKPDKDLVKQFLNQLNGIAIVNPSRNTLQSVNSYLM